MRTYKLFAHTQISHESITSVAYGLVRAKSEAKRMLKDHPTAFEVIIVDPSKDLSDGRIVRQIRRDS